jgi:hypothetical protein
MVYTYTGEFYKTTYRAVGVGWASGMGRIGGIIMPYIVIPLVMIDPYDPFLGFGIFSAICTAVTYALPYDTLGRPLDLANLNDYIELSKL